MRSEDVYEEAAAREDRDDRMDRDEERFRGQHATRDDQTTVDDELGRDGRDGREDREDTADMTIRDEQPATRDEVLDRDERVSMPAGSDGADAPFELFGEDDVNRFRGEWREIQAKFVDDPREAVRGADNLVTEVMDSLTTTFNSHKHELESQWQQGEEAETEDLRQALRRYRTFFDQLLNA